MKKNDFIEKFPDVMALHIETDTVLSRQAKEDKVLIVCNTFQYGLIAYKSHGRNIDIFVSKKMKEELDKMTPGYRVTDPNTGEVGTVVSDKFIVSGNYCVRVKFPCGEDVYDCEYFIK